MPEGDTVYLAATRLRAALAGRALTAAELRVPRHATARLAGRRVLDVAARGKHLLFRLDDGLTLHTHFEMEGAWHLYRPGRRPRGPEHEVRAVLANEDWVAVGLRLAATDLVPTADEDALVGHLGPDLLGDDGVPVTDGGWDAAEAVRRLTAEPARPVGEALLDQRNLAGVGNVYKSELCFLRGLDPWTPVGDVADVPALVSLARRVLLANRTTGSQVTTGDPVSSRSRWVYGRAGLPCRRCGTAVRRAAAGRGAERVTYWCPSCQPRRAGGAGA